MKRLVLILTLLLTPSVLRGGELSLPASLQKVAFDQHLDEQLPLAVPFKDEAGKDVLLGDYFEHGKPVILVLGYFRCPMLCSEVSNGLVRALLDIDLRLGSDFDIITVSIDHRETPEMAAAKKQSYLERYGRAGGEAGWHFLTGTEESIAARDAGGRLPLSLRCRPRSICPRQRHHRPHAGRQDRTLFLRHSLFATRDLRLGLVEASENRIGSASDQILLYCFHYDPTEGRYGVAILNILRIAGVLTVAGIALMLYCLWRGERRRAQAPTKVGV